MFDSKLMLLVGAGGSVPVGIPGMRGMAAAFKADVRNGSDAWKAYQLLRTLGASDDLEELLQLANEIVAFPDQPVARLAENCVSPRSEGKPLSRFRNRQAENTRIVRRLHDELIQWISEACLKFDRTKAQQIYGRFVNALANNDVPVFTTNYDAVLEEVAAREHVDIADNFIRDDHGRLLWRSDLKGFDRGGLKIVNLHGSIQWHADPSGKVEKIPQPAKVNREGAPLEQLLIFPTRFKHIYRQHYFPLYTSFTRTLGNAKTLIVVGHSLRDEYLLAAIRERARSSDFSVLLIDKETPRAINQLREAGDDSRVIHIRREIQTICPVLLRAVSTIDPNDMIEYWKDAASKIMRGRKDKLTVKAPQWCTPGQKLQVSISVDSVVGGGAVRCAIKDSKGGGKRLPVDLTVNGGADDWVVDGIVNETRTATLGIPTELSPGAHELVTAIQDLKTQKVIAQHRRTLKVKGSR